MIYYELFADRSVLAVTGGDARDFLQGLVTKDMRKVTPGTTVFSALLSPQGRFLFDFFITGREDGFWLETDKGRLPELVKHLTMYRLRAKVEFKELNLQVAVVWEIASRDDKPEEVSTANCLIAYADPRPLNLGDRMLFDKPPVFTGMAQSDFEQYRIALGVPEGAKDLTVDRSILLEYGYDELGAVDFDKGCYVGQEVTARSKHRASLRKFIHQLQAESPLPPKGTPVLAGGREVGIITSIHKNHGLALLNHEETVRAGRENQPLIAGNVTVTAVLPAWCRTELAARES